MTAKVKIPANDWRPRWYQMPLWKHLQSTPSARAIQIAHRRWGKDEVCLHFTSASMWRRVGTYWHMLPKANQARKAIWEAVNPHTGRRRIDEAFPKELRDTTHENEMFIRNRNGSTWQVIGSDNYEASIGSPPVGLIFSEWAQANPLAWAYLRPVLAENGGWAAFITTPRGKNHAWKMYKMALEMMKFDGSWFASRQGVGFTKALKENVLVQEMREMQMEWGEEQGASLYEQEYDCSFEAAILGSVYGEQLKKLVAAGRLKKNIYDPALKVHTVWDIGYDDSTFIWFYQLAGSEVRIIDWYQNHLQPITHYAGQITGFEMTLNMIQKPNGEVDLIGAKGQPIEGLEYRRIYEYGEHHGPHDAAYKLLQAGGKSIVEQLYALGITMYAHSAATQANQISATRLTLENTWFDEEKCGEAFELIKQYHFEWDEKKKIFKPEPRHDFTSHGADALELLALIRQSGKMESKEAQQAGAAHQSRSMTSGQIVLPDIHELSLDQSWKDEF